MDAYTLLLFSATVLPLICTPGPDMLFITSQALAGGGSAGLRATAGVCAGYAIHSSLTVLGLAAIIAASPVLFGVLRWLGVAYLIFLALQLIRSATRSGTPKAAIAPTTGRFRRGFITAVLNPKGMMIYMAILPQFVRDADSPVHQAMALSAIFIGLCGLVYAAMSLAMGMLDRTRRLDERNRRRIEGLSGGLLAIAAAGLAMD